MSDTYEEGFANGKTFAIANRFYDPKIKGYNIKGCRTWGDRFNSTQVRGSNWNAGFCEGIKSGLNV